ncbi:hypothetical protein HNR61_003833 [Actinomadura namibiensis]|uniref:Uncharacterized protein n=1 Tax=Actinomadura namibiensis TaxID=182080 RepID=A0A7W3LQ36_ACTNM|nr:hypothetical protein [Actinomadura namibiensis]
MARVQSQRYGDNSDRQGEVQDEDAPTPSGQPRVEAGELERPIVIAEVMVPGAASRSRHMTAAMVDSEAVTPLPEWPG